MSSPRPIAVWLLALLGLGAVGAGCKERPAAPAPPRHVDPEFGFSFVVNPGWSIDARAAAAYHAYLARAAATDGGLPPAPQLNQRQLVSALKRDANGRVKGRLSVFAARASAADFITGYLGALTPPGEKSVQVHDRAEGRQVGGRSYEVARLTVDLGGTTLEQRLFSTQSGEEAVLFSLAAQDAPELAELEAMMGSVQWPAGR